MSEYGDLIKDTFQAEPEAAQAQVVGTVDEDPERAMRAMELGQSFGVSPSVVYSDLDSFERNQKARLASDLVRNNHQLSRYVNSDPMAAKVSNDDFGQLDGISQSLGQFQKAAQGNWKAISSAFKEGFNASAMEREYGELKNWIDSPWWQSFVQHSGFGGAAVALKAMEGVFTGTMYAVGEAGAQVVKDLGGSEASAGRMARDLVAIQQVGLSGQAGAFGRVRAGQREHNVQMEQGIQEAQRALRAAKPYLDAGKEPPFGLHPAIDEAKIAQGKEDLSALDDAFKEAQKSATRERSPELFSRFIAQHTDAKIGVSADAVVKAFGEKAFDEKVLGWVPGLKDQLEAGLGTGGDVHIPLADWLAKADPEVAKALQDDIRVRPGGVTKNEAAVVSAAKVEPIEGMVQSPVEDVRASASLKPMFEGVQEPKVQLQRQEPTKGFEEFHGYTIADAQGNSLGEVTLLPSKDGKLISVEGIEARLGPRALGPAAVRDLLEQIKQLYPDAEKLTGFRVSGAREKAALARDEYVGENIGTQASIPLKASASISDLEHFAAVIEGGDWLDYGLGTKALIKPKELWTENEARIAKVVEDEINRIAPKQLEVQAAHDIRLASDEAAGGVHIQFYDRVPLILWSLRAEDAVGMGRHEALHHLRQQGFFTETEWSILSKAAESEGWLEKHRIDKDYAELPREQKIEEAVAKEFETWRRGKKEDGELGPIFKKINDLLESIQQKLATLLGHEPTWQELFDKADKGEIGSREGNKPITEGVHQAASKQLELPVTRMEDREVFAKAQAIGMTADQYRRYMKRIEQRRKEDFDAQAEKAIAEERRRQTKTWKENEVAEREKAVEIINQRPDVSADKLFREGVLYGERVGETPKLREDLLTAEQKAGLPKAYVGKDGLHPDDVAPLFGYQSGTDMLNHLVALEQDRRTANMNAASYNRLLINQQTERLMKEKYGDLDENILREAKDRVLTDTQLDLLHEEMIFFAEKAGAELPLPNLKQWVVENFNKQMLTDISSDKLLAAAGKAGKEAEMALLKQDVAEAFKQKQRQYLATTMAREAATAEKEVEAFAKTAKRFEAREVKNIDQQFTDYIQDLLISVGLPVKRSVQELQANQARHGYGSFDAFVESKRGDGWELAVHDYIAAKQLKPMEQMTVEEFRDFKDAIDSLAYVGKEVNKLEMAGKKIEFEEFKAEVLDNIRSLPPRDKNKPMRIPFRFDAEMVRMEEVVKDLDLRQQMGPLFNALIRPMAESKHTEYSMLEDLSKKLRDIRGFSKGWQRTLNDSIPQTFFHDPYDGTLFDLTREHMIQIMLNFGTRSNIEKFTRGYVGKEEAPKFEAQLRQLFDQHAKPEDWQYVQHIWDLFEDWRKGSEKLYYDLSGVAPKWIPAEAIDTPHGQFRGGYYPVIYDRLRSNIGVVEEKTDTNSLFGTNYFRATPGNAYTKERTGYVDRVQFQTSIEQVGQRMQQMIHDISYRRAVVDANKVIHDREIRGAIRKHYGAEYEAQLYPWLKDIANHFNSNEQAVGMANAVLRRARWNLMGHALGLNLKVIGSPDIGLFNPWTIANVMWDREANVALAHEKSREIPHTFRNMDRDFRERLEQTIATKGLGEAQAAAVRWSFYPLVKVSQGFRITTFVTEYKKALDKGMDDGSAAAWADSIVRERHGSGGLPDLPAIMRSSEAMKLNTLFYGFFNSMYNWQRQAVGDVKRGDWKHAMEVVYGSILIPAAFGAAIFNQSKEGDSWFKTIAKALLLQPLSTVVFAREFANFFVEGFPARSPLATLMQAVGSAVSDVKKVAAGKKVEKPIQHTANVVGLTTGLPMAQIGRTGQFYYDVSRGQQRPKNILEWIRGTIHGEAKLKK